MSRYTVCSFWFAVSCLCSLLPCGAIQLAYDFKPRERMVYQFTQSGKTTFEFPESQVKEMLSEAHVTNVQEVLSVDSSKNAFVQMQFKDGRITMTTSSKPFGFPFDFPPMQLKISRRGAVLSAQPCSSAAPAPGPTGSPSTSPSDVSGLSASSLNLSQFFGQMTALRFPRWEAKAGSVWSQTSLFTSPTGETINITTRSTWQRTVDVKGQSCAEIESLATFPMHAEMSLLGTKMHVDGTYKIQTTYHFALTAGRMLDLQGKADVAQKILLTSTDTASKKDSVSEVLAKSDINFSMQLQ